MDRTLKRLKPNDIIGHSQFKCPYCNMHFAPLQYTSGFAEQGSNTSLFMHVLTRHPKIDEEMQELTWGIKRKAGHPCLICGARMDQYSLTGYVYGFRFLVHMLDMDDAEREEHITALAMMGLL